MLFDQPTAADKAVVEHRPGLHNTWQPSETLLPAGFTATSAPKVASIVREELSGTSHFRGRFLLPQEGNGTSAAPSGPI